MDPAAPTVAKRLAGFAYGAMSLARLTVWSYAEAVENQAKTQCYMRFGGSNTKNPNEFGGREPVSQ
jgi:hypothetical protein